MDTLRKKVEFLCFLPTFTERQPNSTFSLKTVLTLLSVHVLDTDILWLLMLTPFYRPLSEAMELYF
jgi:hypothetical protein